MFIYFIITSLDDVTYILTSYKAQIAHIRKYDKTCKETGETIQKRNEDRISVIINMKILSKIWLILKFCLFKTCHQSVTWVYCDWICCTKQVCWYHHMIETMKRIFELSNFVKRIFKVFFKKIIQLNVEKKVI